MDHRMADAQIAALAPEYRVLTWDVRGHGASQPLDGDFSVRGAAGDLLALLDHLGYQQAVLVGHSMGGYISQELLFLHPERVTALVAVDTTCITLTHPPVIALGMRLTPMAFSLCPYAIVKPLAALATTVTPQVRAYVVEVMSRLSKKDFLTLWSAAMNCRHDEPGYRIAQPLLITHGEHDTLGFGLIWQQSKAWAARDSHARYSVIPAAAHNANQENPAFFNALLLEFLSRHVRIENV